MLTSSAALRRAALLSSWPVGRASGTSQYSSPSMEPIQRCACVCVRVCVCLGVKDQREFGISVRKEKVKRVRGVCRRQ